MSVHCLAEALEDTAALNDIAKRAGITLAQAREAAAAFADLPVVQTIRICTTAQSDRIRRVNRETRRAEPRE